MKVATVPCGDFMILVGFYHGAMVAPNQSGQGMWLAPTTVPWKHSTSAVNHGVVVSLNCHSFLFQKYECLIFGERKGYLTP